MAQGRPQDISFLGRQLVDLSSVVDTQREEYTETALLPAYCYNKITKKRSYDGGR